MMSFFFSSRRRHTRCSRDWSSDVCSSDLWSRGAARRCLQRSCRVVEGREPAVHVLDVIHQVSAAGTIPGGKAGRAARRAHVRAIYATRAGHDVGGIEEVVALSELARTSAGDNAWILHPEEVLDVRTGLVDGGKEPTSPEEDPEVSIIILCQRRRRRDRSDRARRRYDAGRGLRRRIGERGDHRRGKTEVV